MNEDCQDTLTKVEAYKIAIATRNFEIDLYWKRSLFFWGFIATAFLGYGSLFEDNKSNLALLVSCFGLICSFCWSLVNRGSKYWQEHWERKVTDFENKLGDIELFRAEDKRDNSKSWWLGSRKFSVSRLAIALSDFTVFIWIGLICNKLLALIPYQHIHLSSETKILFCVIFTVIYAILIRFKCRSNPWHRPEQ